MDLYLVAEQRTQFGKLRTFLERELPDFVNTYPSMREALVRYGKVEASTPSALVAAHLSGALKWGTAPKVMVMARSMVIGGSASGDWRGTYDPKRKVITLCKSLVTQWQKMPDDKILRRSMIVVMLHELVHFLNHEVQPATTIHSEPGHLKGTFHKEAFGAPPLSWEMAHYMVINEVLKTKGVE